MPVVVNVHEWQVHGPITCSLCSVVCVLVWFTYLLAFLLASFSISLGQWHFESHIHLVFMEQPGFRVCLKFMAYLGTGVP